MATAMPTAPEEVPGRRLHHLAFGPLPLLLWDVDEDAYPLQWERGAGPAPDVRSRTSRSAPDVSGCAPFTVELVLRLQPGADRVDQEVVSDLIARLTRSRLFSGVLQVVEAGSTAVTSRNSESRMPRSSRNLVGRPASPAFSTSSPADAARPSREDGSGRRASTVATAARRERYGRRAVRSSNAAQEGLDDAVDLPELFEGHRHPPPAPNDLDEEAQADRDDRAVRSASPATT